MPTPSFINLWNGYPTVASPCDGPWGNQCAIRMSIALNTEMTIKINKSTYSEPKCAHEHARGAESLANWLWKNHLGRPKIYTDNVNGKKDIQSKQGIIFFKDCFTRGGEAARSGDHIDLWFKGIAKGYTDPANKASQIWFWELT